MSDLSDVTQRQRFWLMPIDSTIIPLTSKLFWQQAYHQVKLMNGINLTQGNSSAYLIHFGQGHDARFALILCRGDRLHHIHRAIALWLFYTAQARSIP
ncbi:hypothetical protein [Coleofasciculus sp. H7-2]|uniref:hypothetical protein n=1 Tax=Coleofasciculus sp. H7-2 TaxID=3351545 RepID=UPI00366D3F90